MSKQAPLPPDRVGQDSKSSFDLEGVVASAGQGRPGGPFDGADERFDRPASAVPAGLAPHAAAVAAPHHPTVALAADQRPAPPHTPLFVAGGLHTLAVLRPVGPLPLR